MVWTKYFKTIELGTISAGGTATGEWTPEADITIHKIIVSERGNSHLRDVYFTIKVADRPITLDVIPAEILGTNFEYCYKPEVDVAKGTKIWIKAENRGTSDKTVDVIIEFSYK